MDDANFAYSLLPNKPTDRRSRLDRHILQHASLLFDLHLLVNLIVWRQLYYRNHSFLMNSSNPWLRKSMRQMYVFGVATMKLLRYGIWRYLLINFAQRF